MLCYEGIVILLAIRSTFSDGIPGTTGGSQVTSLVGRRKANVLEVPNNRTLVVSSSDLQDTVVVTAVGWSHERDLDSEDFLQSRCISSELEFVIDWRETNYL